MFFSVEKWGLIILRIKIYIFIINCFHILNIIMNCWYTSSSSYKRISGYIYIRIYLRRIKAWNTKSRLVKVSVFLLNYHIKVMSCIKQIHLISLSCYISKIVWLTSIWDRYRGLSWAFGGFNDFKDIFCLRFTLLIGIIN